MVGLVALFLIANLIPPTFENAHSLYGQHHIADRGHSYSTVACTRTQAATRFSKFRLLREYIAGKVKELDEYNQEYCAEDESKIIVNARHLTNLGTFRAYLLAYLQNHPLVHQELTTLVRQLEPGPHGLPLQIWTHIKDTRWPVYEAAQADIFDHILAVAPEFGLRIFQQPSGHDLASLRSSRTPEQSTSASAINGKKGTLA